MFGDNPNVFCGIKVLENAYIPVFTSKIKLSNDVDYGKEFRAEFNQWLDDFFGLQRYFIIYNNDTIITHPENVKCLKEVINNLDVSKNKNSNKSLNNKEENYSRCYNHPAINNTVSGILNTNNVA